jgi:hypothetical protein
MKKDWYNLAISKGELPPKKAAEKTKDSEIKQEKMSWHIDDEKQALEFEISEECED